MGNDLDVCRSEVTANWPYQMSSISQCQCTLNHSYKYSSYLEQHTPVAVKGCSCPLLFFCASWAAKDTGGMWVWRFIIDFVNRISKCKKSAAQGPLTGNFTELSATPCSLHQWSFLSSHENSSVIINNNIIKSIFYTKAYNTYMRGT